MTVEETLERWQMPILLAVAAAALAGAVVSRFVQDDAFISFQYARSLAEGNGLTWFGDRVEGYTNLLWVLLVSAGCRAGVDPVPLSQWLGLASFAAVLYLVPRLTRAGDPSFLPTLTGLLLLATNASLQSYATGGLETMLQAALATAILERALADGPLAWPRATLVSLLAAAGLLVRLDTAVLLVVPFVLLLARAARAPRPGVTVGSLLLPAAAVVGLSFVFRISYYGELLPNTFAAKVTHVSWRNGLVYVGRFFEAYLLWIPLVASVGALVLARRRPRPVVTVLASTVLVWLLYVVAVGGDFMEFRFLVPCAPPLFALLGLLVVDAGRLAGGPTLAALLVSGCAWLASIHHARTFRGITPDKALDSVPILATGYGLYPSGDFRSVGEALADQLRGVDARLAATAVGAIPYYSRIPTVDMIGLNDREVARHGILMPASYPRPGHQRCATLAQLVARSVNVVLGDPTVVRRGWLSARPDPREVLSFVLRSMGAAGYPRDRVRVVAIPIDRSSALLAWILIATPALDARALERGWEDVSLRLR